MRDDNHARPIADDSGFYAPRAMLAPGPVTVPLNAVTPIAPTLDGLVGDSVDVINNLTQGALLRIVPGVPPGPRTRTFELGALPDAGAGNLALPALGGVPGTGTITAVDDTGAAAASGATGLSFAGGAYAASLDPISPTLYLGGGWAMTFDYRVPAGAKNSGKYWISAGKRGASNYGITVSETSAGQLAALIEDPRQVPVKVQSATVGRDAIHSARLAWNAATKQVQWSIDGVASGAAVTLSFVPEIGGGAVQLGASLAPSATGNPMGAIYRFAFEATAADQANSYYPVGPSTTLSAADARGLRVDTGGILAPVAAAGDVSFSYPTAGGQATQDFAFAFGGYVAPADTLTSYVAAEMPYAPLDLGSADPNGTVLVLTPPARGKIVTPLSSQFFGVGALAGVIGDGIPQRDFLQYAPSASGKNPGSNPNGSLSRGFADLLRTQQAQSVRVTNVVEMNRAPRLNGGGEAWGHAADVWVPILALGYGYDDGGLLYPTIDGETPATTVAAIPAAGEGSIRVLRTGADLRVGDAVAYADVKRLGWYKPGVASVSNGCALRLIIAAPGAPTGSESYALKITDAPRAAGLTWWEQADTLYADRHARIRWASRGGDWAGSDGAWGSVPFATSATVSKAAVLTIDVTGLVKANGAEFFLMPPGTGAITVTPGFYPADTSKEPMLRVTGGTRAGSYRATRCAGLADSDSTGWRLTNSAPFACKRTQPVLLAYDGLGALGDATRIELVLNVTSVSGGGTTVQVYRPAAQPPRPGPRVSVGPTPALQRADLIAKVDTNADWYAMLNSADSRNQSGSGQPTNYTIANGCYYGGIPTGFNAGISLLRAFFKADGTGYPTVRLGRMIGWHLNYQPGDASLTSGIGVSGKSPGLLATGSGSLSNLTAGFGGRAASGFSGYTCRMQRGSNFAPATHASTSPLAPFLAYGDYDYFMSGSTNGATTFAINPIPRMAWAWIESVHSTNSVFPDGTWANDGVFELYVNGRKQCESRRLEYRIAGNAWLWDAIWFDEYNGGTSANLVDRLWPFVIGPTYAVASTDPIAPPPGWNVPFVTAAGVPDSVPLAYKPDW